MARSLRLAYEGAIYHVTARGNERREIFRDDGDCMQFLNCLAACDEAYGVRLHLFCLMPNHFHLVVETPRANLGGFMHSLLTRYSVYFNRRHHRRGHLTQGRYGAKVVEGGAEGNAYLLALSRYVHLNPAFTNATKRLSIWERMDVVRGYRWSSYRGYVKPALREGWVTYDPVLAQVEANPKDRIGSYRDYVAGGLARDDEEMRKALWASARSIGGERFREWVEQKHEKLSEKAGCREDVAFRRVRGVVGVEDVLRAVAGFCGMQHNDLLRPQRGGIARGLASRWLCRYSGLTQRRAAQTLGLTTGAAVSAQLQTLSRRLASDEPLREKIRNAESRLEKQVRKTGSP